MSNHQNDNDGPRLIPIYHRQLPRIVDELQTATSEAQDDTVEECLPLLNQSNRPFHITDDFNEIGLPPLLAEAHVSFAQDALGQFPGGFVTMDASRPWMLYWSLLSMYLLQEDIRVYQARVVKTYRPLQNSRGGFGGGQGHLAHLAGTYAALLTLALVGGEEAYSIIDRKAMWQWLGDLKQADGGFRVCYDGEEDTRGAYCAFVAITLLDLPRDLPPDAPARASGMTKFSDGVGEYLSRCQTYEGGIASSPGNEAHGAYTFCALACLCLLDTPQKALNEYVDISALIRWLSSRQYAPEGGLAGRTNKLVDGCYSHWIGGCWPLVEAALDGPMKDATTPSTSPLELFATESLTRYILNCCQAGTGGLRDKPSKRPDAYHTCYNLAGLSMTTFKHYYLGSTSDKSPELLQWATIRRDDSITQNEDRSSERYLNPIYVIPHDAVRAMIGWAKAQNTICSTNHAR